MDKLLDRREHWEKLLDRPVQFLKCCGWSLFLLGAGVGIRTTALFLSLVPGIPLIKAFGKAVIQVRLARVIKIGVTGAATLLIFLALFVLYLCYGYWQFCTDDKSWFCSNTIPNVYGAVQEKFWQVGFLNYYAAERAVMIVFGSFSIICAVLTAFNNLHKKQF